MSLSSALRRFAVIAVFSGAPWLPAQSFDLDSGREPVVSLDGLWRFHPGDSPAASATSAPQWADPAFDDSAWRLLRGDESWATQGFPSMSGFAWYRFTVKIPANQNATSLLLAPIVTSFELYVDGRRVGGSGRMPPALIPSTEFRYHLFPLTSGGSNSLRTVHVAIRVWHSPIWSSYVGGGPYLTGHLGGQLAGDPGLLALEQRHRQVARNIRYVDAYSYSVTAGLVGFAILCLFLIRKAEREYLWFAMILLAQAAEHALTIAQEIYSWPPILVYDLVDGIFAAVTVVAALCFFSRILNVRTGLIALACLALAALSPLPAIFYWPGWFSAPASGAIQLACLLPAVWWILSVLVISSVRGNTDARLLLVPTLLDMGYYLADNLAIVFNQAGWTGSPHVLEPRLPLPPFSMEIGILFHLVFLLAMVVFLVLRFTRARRREAWLASEFEAARQIQHVLLPDKLDQCPGFAVECVYQPADQVGGDFFQQIADGRGGILLVVGDVSGKGLPAAMLVSVLVGAIRAEAAHGTGPPALLCSLNDRAMGRSHGGFTTCLAAHITAGGLLTLANAGHVPPYLNGLEIVVPGSLPLGIVEHAQYETVTFTLKPGDRLTFVSDGVPESQDKSGTLLGFDRTQSISRKPAAEIAEAARNFGQLDDITVVTVEFSGATAAPVIAQA
ncbi:MAG: SpoIIE family protein phosphatase [Terracidiphilus sp.]|jgi:hypothetical protein